MDMLERVVGMGRAAMGQTGTEGASTEIQSFAIDLNSLLAAVVGGLIAGGASLAAIAMQNSHQNKLRHNIKKENDATNAMLLFDDVRQMTNFLGGMKGAIDETFSESTPKVDPPGVRLRPMVGMVLSLPKFDISHSAFLLQTGKNDLFNHLSSYFSEVEVAHQLVVEFNIRRRAYLAFQEKIGLENTDKVTRVQSDDTSTHGAVEFEGISPIVQMFSDGRLAELNQLVAELREFVKGEDNLLSRGKQILGDYQAAAQSHFGDKFYVSQIQFNN